MNPEQEEVFGVVYPRRLYLLAEFNEENEETPFMYEIDEETHAISHIACESDLTDTACCPTLEYCVYNEECYADGESITIPDGDDIDERCIASSPGEWYDDIEYICDNSIDDDEDGDTDLDDTDCNSIIRGAISDVASGAPLEGARVDAASVNASAFVYSEAGGIYELSVKSGRTYDVAASMEGYAPLIVADIPMPIQNITSIDFELGEGISPCKADCTTPPTDTCDPDCHLWNGCYYFSDEARQVCNGKQPGFRVGYSENREIVCCGLMEDGGPYEISEEIIPVAINESIENIVVVRRPVFYDGELVNMVIVVYNEEI